MKYCSALREGGWPSFNRCSDKKQSPFVITERLRESSLGLEDAGLDGGEESICFGHLIVQCHEPLSMSSEGSLRGDDASAQASRDIFVSF